MEKEKNERENVFLKIFNNVKSELNNRRKSKVIGSYAITWLIINWKAPIYLIFSSDSLNKKLGSGFCNPTYESWLLPLIGVGIYMLIIPSIEAILEIIQELINNILEFPKLRINTKFLRNKIKNKIEIERLQNDLYAEMSNENEIRKLNSNINTLQSKINDLEDLVNSKDELIDQLLLKKHPIIKGDLEFYGEDSVEFVLKNEFIRSPLLSMSRAKGEGLPLNEINTIALDYFLKRGLAVRDKETLYLSDAGFKLAEIINRIY